MITRDVTIASAVGLHARPAALFVQAVTRAGVSIKISKEGRNPADARSLLAVMALGAKHGETVTLTTDDDDAAPVLDELVELLSTDLDA